MSGSQLRDAIDERLARAPLLTELRVSAEGAADVDALPVERRRARGRQRRLARRHHHRIRDVGRQRLTSRLRLHPERVVDQGQEREVVHRLDGVHQVEEVVLRRQLTPRQVGHRRIAVQLVGQAQQRRLEWIPTCRRRPLGDALDLRR
jgi:hypothetical protein